MCHFLISCHLNVYVSFADMMQGDKENIKVNFRDCISIVNNLVVSLYFTFIAKWHYTTLILNANLISLGITVTLFGM